jgi:hypothetical protein
MPSLLTCLGSRCQDRTRNFATILELYIGHIKEAVRQDMEGSDSPMVFWEYCLEMRARIHNLTASPTSNFMELMPTLSPLERRETYLTFVNLLRMTGVTYCSLSKAKGSARQSPWSC